MKPNDVFAGLDWEFDDAPAVIPKRLWDSVLDMQESIVAVADATFRATQRFIGAAREGHVLDDAQLAELDRIISEQLEDLAKEKEEVLRLRSILKWVPPADMGTTH